MATTYYCEACDSVSHVPGPCWPCTVEREQAAMEAEQEKQDALKAEAKTRCGCETYYGPPRWRWALDSVGHYIVADTVRAIDYYRSVGRLI